MCIFSGSFNDGAELADRTPKKRSRLKSILGPGGPIPVSKSMWWAGVKSGRFPEPVKLGPRTTAWRVEDIRSLIDRGIETGAINESTRTQARGFIASRCVDVQTSLAQLRRHEAAAVAARAAAAFKSQFRF